MFALLAWLFLLSLGDYSLLPMDLRRRPLDQLDARTVDLPHGTEVVTRVDRIHDGRRIPQGSIGRVTKVDGDSVEVTVVGVGVLRYARVELSPRRVGQALFAQRRADVTVRRARLT